MIKPGTMKRFFPEPIKSSSGRFKISHVVMDKAFVEREKNSACFTPGGYYEVWDLEPGTYVKLTDAEERYGREIIMSDTPMELRTNKPFVEHAHGNVLIAGLGIGFVLLTIQEKPEVKSITVVELQPELIELVQPKLSLNEKVKIVRADIFQWLPEEPERFNTIYFDIWNSICGDNYPQTKTLHARFRKYLNRKGDSQAWMDSWRRDEFKALHFNRY